MWAATLAFLSCATLPIMAERTLMDSEDQDQTTYNVQSDFVYTV